jgi:hypothetical protein
MKLFVFIGHLPVSSVEVGEAELRLEKIAARLRHRRGSGNQIVSISGFRPALIRASRSGMTSQFQSNQFAQQYTTPTFE